MLDSPLFKRFLIITIVVASSHFYTIIFIPKGFREMAEMGAVGLILAYLLIDRLYGTPKGQIPKQFKLEVYLFLLATFFSMFIANAFHGQDFTTTAIAQRYMYFYFFYFFIHSLKIRVEDIDSMIIPFALVYLAIFMAQYVAYPTRLVDSRVAYARGTVRIFLPGGSFVVLAYYKSLQILMRDHKIRYGLLCLAIFTVTGILQGTRQSLASLIMLTMAYIFFSKQVKSRALMILMAVLAGFSVFIIFQDIFMNLIALSQKHMEADEENIRITSMKFFTGPFMPHKLAYIFGNGMDSMNNAYGIRVAAYRAMGLYQSDIGMIGDYSRFGILFVIAQMSITLRIIFGKLPKELVYFRYFMISRFLVSFTGSNMFAKPSEIVFICFMLYMIEHYKHKEKQEKLKEQEILSQASP